MCVSSPRTSKDFNKCLNIKLFQKRSHLSKPSPLSLVAISTGPFTFFVAPLVKCKAPQ